MIDAARTEIVYNSFAWHRNSIQKEGRKKLYQRNRAGRKNEKKVIIDCDVGVDDALALILGFHSPGLEIKAVTGVNGNVPIDTVFPNIQKVLSLIQPPDQPVIARGASHPLKGKSFYAHSVHGEDGLGGAKTFYLHDPFRRERGQSSHCRRRSNHNQVGSPTASPFPTGLRKVLKEAGKEGMRMLLIS